METSNTALLETPLRRILREQGRTAVWLSTQLGIGYSRTMRLLTGENSLTLQEGLRAAAVLGVPVETFVSGSAK